MMNKILILILYITVHHLFAQGIVINEVMSSNSATIFDEDDDASDWIELYNSSSTQVNLDGYYLSDDSSEVTKWRFESAVINPGEYLLVFASDKDTLIDYWHTNFKVSADGEVVILSDTSGKVVDQIFVPESKTDISYGRESDGSLVWMFQEPSPGSENTGEEIPGYADTVSASIPAGFYSSSVTVELSAGNSVIYYTLDGSDPDLNSTKYTTPITINKTAVLKATGIKADHQPSSIVHYSYFINEESDLAVVSLISDPYNLFDEDYGIYATGSGTTPNYEMDWERPAHVQFFDEEQNLGFAENCGINIYGGYTRRFPQKSFAVKFKDPYNSSSLEYPLFPGFYVTTFKSFILRNSGNDFQYTHIRDAMMQTLIKDLDMDYLEYRPAATYINGEYWGIYNIREKINEHYVANRHGVDPDNIDMLEGNMEVIHGDSLHYQALVDYISSNDMSTSEAYDYVNSMIDLDNCLLYFAAHVYYNSQDWPANNVKYWRERSGNGKWRWIMYDLDFGFNLYETTGQAENHVHYIFSGEETRPGSNPPWSTLLPRKLVENARIKTKFINLVADLLNTNFRSERVVNLINEMSDNIANEAVKHRERWDISNWTVQEHLQRMRTFAEERPEYLRGFIKDFFDVGDNGLINLTSSGGGSIKLNSLNLNVADSVWQGIYFRGNPITVKAIPADGYKFDGWTGDVTSNGDSLSISVTGSTDLHANFVIDTSVIKNIVINEINYNSSEDFELGDWIELYNRSEQSINISDWYFSDSDSAHKFIILAGTIIEPGNYLVLVEDDSAFSSRFPDVTNYLGETGFGLSGSGEFMKLVNGDGEIIDSLTYDDNLPWPEEADGDGSTLELLDALSDNSKGENWRASIGTAHPGKQIPLLLQLKKKKIRYYQVSIHSLKITQIPLTRLQVSSIKYRETTMLR